MSIYFSKCWRLSCEAQIQWNQVLSEALAALFVDAVAACFTFPLLLQQTYKILTNGRLKPEPEFTAIIVTTANISNPELEEQIIFKRNQNPNPIIFIYFPTIEVPALQWKEHQNSAPLPQYTEKEKCCDGFRSAVPDISVSASQNWLMPVCKALFQAGRCICVAFLTNLKQILKIWCRILHLYMSE